MNNKIDIDLERDFKSLKMNWFTVKHLLNEIISLHLFGDGTHIHKTAKSSVNRIKLKREIKKYTRLLESL